MINVSDTFKQVLKEFDVRHLAYKVTFLRNFGAEEIDITDRVKEIEVTRELDSSNASCRIVIDNSDYKLGLNNHDSELNYNRGVFEPLLKPGRVVRVYAGLMETSSESGATTVVTKKATINNFAGAEFVNTEPTPDGVMLAYTLGNEYLILSQENISNYLMLGKDHHYSSAFYEYDYGQIFKINTTTKKYLSRFSVYIRAADPKLVYGQGCIWCTLYKWKWDWPGNNWNSHNDAGSSPPFDPRKNAIKTVEVGKRSTGWIDFKFDDCFIEPNIDYMLFLESSSYATRKDSSNQLDYVAYNSVSGSKIFEVFRCDIVNQQNILQDQSLTYRIYVRDIIYKNSGSVVVQFDCGPRINRYLSIESEYTGSVTFEFASSTDGQVWSAWYPSLDSVPVARFLKVRANLSTSDTLYSPVLKNISLNYETVVAESPQGMVPIFTGLTGDDIEEDVNTGTIVLGCRDFSKGLQDIFVSLSKSYDYVVLENVIDDLLRTYLPDSIIHSNWGEIEFISQPTYYLIKHYQLKNINLWDALQQLVSSIGWYLMFDESGILWLFDRKKQEVADDIFDEDIITIETLNLTDADVRNDILVKAETPSGIIQVRVQDNDSIRDYGRRFMEVDRSLSSFIYDQETAQKLANAILEDLRYPRGMVNITLPFYPIIQLGDIIGINSQKSGLQSIDQLYKVIGITHTLSDTTKQTVLKAQLFKNIWVATSITPSPPAGLTAEIVTRTVNRYPGCNWPAEEKGRVFYYPKISWSYPTTNTNGTEIVGLVGFNIYRSTDGSNFTFVGFVPAVLSGADLSVNWFIDYWSGPGTFYYRMESVNRWSKKSPPSESIIVEVPSYQVLS